MSKLSQTTEVDWRANHIWWQGSGSHLLWCKTELQSDGLEVAAKHPEIYNRRENTINRFLSQNSSPFKYSLLEMLKPFFSKIRTSFLKPIVILCYRVYGAKVLPTTEKDTHAILNACKLNPNRILKSKCENVSFVNIRTLTTSLPRKDVTLK